MKAALLLPLLVLGCVVMAEGHTRKTLAAPTPARTASSGTTTTTTPPAQGTINTSKGPVKTGTVATGNPRPTAGQQSAKATTGAAKVEWSQAEKCRTVHPREQCERYEQSECCEYINSRDRLVGCVLGSNLYTCNAIYNSKPLSVCCS